MGEFELSEEAEEGGEDSVPGVVGRVEMNAGGSGSLKRILCMRVSTCGSVNSSSPTIENCRMISGERDQLLLAVEERDSR